MTNIGISQINYADLINNAKKRYESAVRNNNDKNNPLHLHSFIIKAADVKSAQVANGKVWEDINLINEVSVTEQCTTCNVTRTYLIPFMKERCFKAMLQFDGIKKAIENNEIKFISDFTDYPDDKPLISETTLSKSSYSAQELGTLRTTIIKNLFQQYNIVNEDGDRMQLGDLLNINSLAALEKFGNKKVAIAKLVPTADGNEIKFICTKDFMNHLLTFGESDLYL